MKILLTQDVEKLGQTGDVLEVAGGYGRNFLIPKGFAVLATRGQVKQAEERRAAGEKKLQSQRREFDVLAGKINGQTIRFTVRSGDLDRLYGSITSADIAEKASALAGETIDRRIVMLDEPIKRIGIYPIKIRFMSGVEPLLNVVVEGEAGTLQLPDIADETVSADTE
ncbi:MAG: 50S ribosomal protein L9 [Roseiflexaceae bacterium]|nr:50S ribosomal protein L9 [Roseiflexaceae bacterium]